MKLTYNPKDKNSIIAHAKKLKGKSLRQVCDPNVLDHSYSGKGNFGQVLEKFYFGYEPNPLAEADFAQIGMELKSSPLKQLKNNEYRSKERLVLNIINYFNVVNQNFENSDFIKKNACILLIFYLHKAGHDILDLIVKLVDEWSFPSTDLEIIKKDWETIKKKIADGKAHELSEGDTYYLGACTKGVKGGSPREQPNNNIKAKQRAYSFKQGYVNHIIASIANDNKEKYGKLITNNLIAKKQTIEDVVISKFKPYYGKTIEELVHTFHLEFINKKSKQYFSLVTKAILNKILEVPLNKNATSYIEEFDKAEIQIKTVRLKANNLPKEDISFPTFKYENLVKEDWENSEFKEILEHKFLYVFYQFESKKLVLRKVKFWNIPYSDLLEVENVWSKAKQIVTNGEIVRGFKTDKNGKVSRLTNFPDKKFSRVSHVRPHAKVASDTYPLPIKDKLTKDNKYTKHCFWLNNSYVKDEIYLK